MRQARKERTQKVTKALRANGLGKLQLLIFNVKKFSSFITYVFSCNAFSERAQQLPEETSWGSYTPKNVIMSEAGDICGQGKLPEANAPPPQTPCTPAPNLPFTSPISSAVKKAESSFEESDVIVDIDSDPDPMEDQPRTIATPSPPSPSPSRPPSSPDARSTTPVPVVTSSGKKRGRPPKSSPTKTPSRSPGRPPKQLSGTSPGRGRPPKSPGKSSKSSSGRGPGRPPGSKKDKLGQSPIRDYLLTGNLPVGEQGRVPTKAQLRGPPPDWTAPSPSEDQKPTTPEVSPQRDVTPEPTDTSAVIVDDDDDDVKVEIKEENPVPDRSPTPQKDTHDTSGRATPTWIREQASEMERMRENEEQQKRKSPSPPRVNIESTSVVESRSKPKKKKKEKRRLREEREQARREKELRLRLLQPTPSPAPDPEHSPTPSPVDIPETKRESVAVPSLRIDLAKKLHQKQVRAFEADQLHKCSVRHDLLCPSLQEESDREASRKPKKKKKKKDKEQSRDRDEDSKKKKRDRDESKESRRRDLDLEKVSV